MEWNNNFNQEELEYYYTEKYLNGGYKGYIIKGLNVSKLHQEQRINKVLKHLNVNRSETILDLGCGDGKVSEFLRDCNSKYIELDIAQSAFPKENLKNRRFINVILNLFHLEIILIIKLFVPICRKLFLMCGIQPSSLFNLLYKFRRP